MRWEWEKYKRNRVERADSSGAVLLPVELKLETHTIYDRRGIGHGTGLK